VAQFKTGEEYGGILPGLRALTESTTSSPAWDDGSLSDFAENGWVATSAIPVLTNAMTLPAGSSEEPAVLRSARHRSTPIWGGRSLTLVAGSWLPA
jgi:hypothetical protein